MRELPAKISYAKSSLQDRFIQQFDGQLKGRYLLAFLVGVQYMGGAPLRAAIEQELGNPHYGLDEWCSARDMVLVFDRAHRAGISMQRLGELVMPAYKRANPEALAGLDVAGGLALLERAYRESTTYGGVSPVHEVEHGRAVLYRTGSPLPCEYFVGAVTGTLHTFGAEGTWRRPSASGRGRRAAASRCAGRAVERGAVAEQRSIDPPSWSARLALECSPTSVDPEG
jgi:hypothetical protein